MKTIYITYTHAGWFGICPVHIGALDTDIPDVRAVHWTLDWLCELCLWIYVAIFMTMDAVGMEPPGYPIQKKGKLTRPYTVEYETHEPS